MHIVNDPTDPDTLVERNRRWHAAWAFRRAMGFRPRDPLTVYERVCADYHLAINRVRMRDWLRGRRLDTGAWPDHLRPRKVVPFTGRKP